MVQVRCCTQRMCQRNYSNLARCLLLYRWFSWCKTSCQKKGFMYSYCRWEAPINVCDMKRRRCIPTLNSPKLESLAVDKERIPCAATVTQNAPCDSHVDRSCIVHVDRSYVVAHHVYVGCDLGGCKADQMCRYLFQCPSRAYTYPSSM